MGQHFLTDKRVLARVVRAAEISPDDVIVEVGPGNGVLTRELVKSNATVVVVELDGGLVTNLASQFNGQQRVTVVKGDAREVEIDSLVGKNTSYKVVANLPYYAASPIIRRFLQATHKPRLMVVMVQREVAENIVAAPGKMRLISVAVQLYGLPRIVSYVKPRSFKPVPKVASAVLRIDVYPTPEVSFDSEQDFFRVVRAGFSSPRKQIRNSLRNGLSISAEVAEEALFRAGVDPTRRAETLILSEWGKLYDAFQCRTTP